MYISHVQRPRPMPVLVVSVEKREFSSDENLTFLPYRPTLLCSSTIQFVDSTYITFKITFTITNKHRSHFHEKYVIQIQSDHFPPFALFFSIPLFLHLTIFFISPNSTEFSSVSLLFPIKFSASPLFIRFKHVTRPFLK